MVSGHQECSFIEVVSGFVRNWSYPRLTICPWPHTKHDNTGGVPSFAVHYCTKRSRSCQPQSARFCGALRSRPALGPSGWSFSHTLGKAGRMRVSGHGQSLTRIFGSKPCRKGWRRTGQLSSLIIITTKRLSI